MSLDECTKEWEELSTEYKKLEVRKRQLVINLIKIKFLNFKGCQSNLFGTS